MSKLPKPSKRLAKSRTKSPINLPESNTLFKPKNKPQKMIQEIWPNAKVIFAIGWRGAGKSHCPIALSLIDILSKSMPLWLSRPIIPCGRKELGFLQGSLQEKYMPWLAPFEDIIQKLGMSLPDLINKEMVELVPVSFLRGRTTPGNHIIDEAQNLDDSELDCILSRIGHGSRIILAGDPEQSDLRDSPLQWWANRLQDIDGIHVVRFSEEDDVREPIIREIYHQTKDWPDKQQRYNY